MRTPKETDQVYKIVNYYLEKDAKQAVSRNKKLNDLSTTVKFSLLNNQGTLNSNKSNTQLEPSWRTLCKDTVPTGELPSIYKTSNQKSGEHIKDNIQPNPVKLLPKFENKDNIARDEPNISNNIINIVNNMKDQIGFKLNINQYDIKYIVPSINKSGEYMDHYISKRYNSGEIDYSDLCPSLNTTPRKAENFGARGQIINHLQNKCKKPIGRYDTIQITPKLNINRTAKRMHTVKGDYKTKPIIKKFSLNFGKIQKNLLTIDHSQGTTPGFFKVNNDNISNNSSLHYQKYRKARAQKQSWENSNTGSSHATFLEKKQNDPDETKLINQKDSRNYQSVGSISSFKYNQSMHDISNVVESVESDQSHEDILIDQIESETKRCGSLRYSIKTIQSIPVITSRMSVVDSSQVTVEPIKILRFRESVGIEEDQDTDHVIGLETKGLVNKVINHILHNFEEESINNLTEEDFFSTHSFSSIKEQSFRLLKRHKTEFLKVSVFSSHSRYKTMRDEDYRSSSPRKVFIHHDDDSLRGLAIKDLLEDNFSMLKGSKIEDRENKGAKTYKTQLQEKMNDFFTQKVKKQQKKVKEKRGLLEILREGFFNMYLEAMLAHNTMADIFRRHKSNHVKIVIDPCCSQHLKFLYHSDLHESFKGAFENEISSNTKEQESWQNCESNEEKVTLFDNFQYTQNTDKTVLEKIPKSHIKRLSEQATLRHLNERFINNFILRDAVNRNRLEEKIIKELETEKCENNSSDSNSDSQDEEGSSSVNPFLSKKSGIFLIKHFREEMKNKDLGKKLYKNQESDNVQVKDIRRFTDFSRESNIEDESPMNKYTRLPDSVPPVFLIDSSKRSNAIKFLNHISSPRINEEIPTLLSQNGGSTLFIREKPGKNKKKEIYKYIVIFNIRKRKRLQGASKSPYHGSLNSSNLSTYGIDKVIKLTLHSDHHHGQ